VGAFLDVSGVDDSLRRVGSVDGRIAHDTPSGIEAMREFTDTDGRAWIASAIEETGSDYKGRLHLVMTPADSDEVVELADVRWNSERSARRTLASMSVVELRRRLRSAVGRGAAGLAS
jgi:hypothetical protein